MMIPTGAVAIKVCTYLVNGPWNAPSAAIAKGTEYLPDTLRFTKLIQASNLTTGFIGGAVVAFFIWYVMKNAHNRKEETHDDDPNRVVVHNHSNQHAIEIEFVADSFGHV